MIKSITLKNFESHEDTTIEFSNGLNLIIGQSNQGKSSIVRALALVVANRFDKDSVRTGASFCSVKVETEKGSITAERGEDTNHWIVETPKEKKEYRNIGLTVPPEVLEILGMGERVHGDLKELPNIMFQLEKHYMLSEIDGKKTSANAIARMMDEAIGIGGMEELIKDIATDFASKKKELGTKNILISELKGKILEESIFEDYKNSIASTKKVFEDVESLEQLLESANHLSTQIDRNKSSIHQIEISLLKSEGIKELSDELSSQIKRYQIIENSITIWSKIKILNNRLNVSQGIEQLSDKVALLVQKQKDLCKAKEVSMKISALNSNLVNEIDFDIDISTIQKANNSISTAEIMLYNARELYKKIRNVSNRLMNSQKELNSKEEAFLKMKSDLGKCPLCGGGLS